MSFDFNLDPARRIFLSGNDSPTRRGARTTIAIVMGMLALSCASAGDWGMAAFYASSIPLLFWWIGKLKTHD
jgi:hypothetical protein